MSFRRRGGFTLIELMIVVAIIGVIAGIAIPAFIRYIKQSKTSEVFLNLKSMGDGAVAYHQVDHYTAGGLPLGDKQFPGATGVTVSHPSTVPPGTKTVVNTAVWNASPWLDLKFRISSPHYYQYTYRSVNVPGALGDSFTASALGDLDDDGVFSTFIIQGSGAAGGEVYITSPFNPPGAEPLE